MLTAFRDQWAVARDELLEQTNEIIHHLSTALNHTSSDDALIEKPVFHYTRSFGRANGLFGSTPKFPTPHNLLFLLENYRRSKNIACADMTLRTLMQMYLRGLFNHIGGGFSRYYTDSR